MSVAPALNLNNGEKKLKEIIDKRTKLTDDLENLETEIYNFEGSYLSDTAAWGNIFRGWEGYTSTKSRDAEKRARKFKESERLFSSSSTTAPQPVLKLNEQVENEESHYHAQKRKRKKEKQQKNRFKAARPDFSSSLPGQGGYGL